MLVSAGAGASSPVPAATSAAAIPPTSVTIAPCTSRVIANTATAATKTTTIAQNVRRPNPDSMAFPQDGAVLAPQTAFLKADRWPG